MNYIFQKQLTQNNKGLGISIPFNGNTGINITYDSKEAIRSNILNFLLTNKRERILNPNIGSTIREQIFEQVTEESLNNIKDIIITNINDYFPQVLLENLNIIPNNNEISIYIKYSIKNTNINDDIQIIF